jgi:NAD(P)H-hydrate epimerase
MSYLPSTIPSTAQLREFEKSWIEQCGSKWGLVLMEEAGSRATQVVHNLWQHAPGLVVILCGSGNNGGDGMVIARHLRSRSVPVAVYYVESTHQDQPQSEAAVNLAAAREAGVSTSKINIEDLNSLQKELNTASIVVDALLGTGLDRPVEGLYQELIEMINRCRHPVIAIDLPSGVNSDNGQIMGAAVHAAATVTFGYLKPGLIQYPAADLCGHLHVVDIGLPQIEPYMEQHQTITSHTALSTRELAQAILPPRYADSHKGSYGTVVTIAGSAQMSGAASLCSVSSLRAGAGVSILAGVEPVIQKLGAPEIMYRLLPSTSSGAISKQAQKLIEEAISEADSVTIGPGLSLDSETVQLVQALLKGINKPCLVDGDALTAVSKNPCCISAASANQFVFTPHPGELSRLLNTDIKDVQSDRYKSVRTAAEKFGCTVMLKGSRTLIANPLGAVYVNSTGNPGMSTAGSGDVLAGIIAGFLAQGVKCYDAAVLGAYVHGAAGDIAAFNLGDTGILAGDIENLIPVAINKIHNGEYPGSSLEVQLITEPFASRPR